MAGVKRIFDLGEYLHNYEHDGPTQTFHAPRMVASTGLMSNGVEHWTWAEAIADYHRRVVGEALRDDLVRDVSVVETGRRSIRLGGLE